MLKGKVTENQNTSLFFSKESSKDFGKYKTHFLKNLLFSYEIKVLLNMLFFHLILISKKLNEMYGSKCRVNFEMSEESYTIKCNRTFELFLSHRALFCQRCANYLSLLLISKLYLTILKLYHA